LNAGVGHCECVKNLSQRLELVMKQCSNTVLNSDRAGVECGWSW
jgi:hypothetical protein